jgi:hypothetical protein
VWVDEKLSQSKTMRDGLGELSEKSREQFKRQVRGNAHLMSHAIYV